MRASIEGTATGKGREGMREWFLLASGPKKKRRAVHHLPRVAVAQQETFHERACRGLARERGNACSCSAKKLRRAKVLRR